MIRLMLVLVPLLAVGGGAGENAPEKAAEEAPKKTGYGLLTLGSFHGGEVEAVSGEKWYAVVQTDKGCELRPVTLKVEAEPDFFYGKDDKEATGKKVSVAEKLNGSCKFLVKGLKKVKPRGIPTFFSGNIELWPHNDLSLDCGPDEAMEVRVDGPVQKVPDRPNHSGASNDDEMVGVGYRIYLGWGGRKHTVFGSNDVFNHAIPSLNWAGDIDQDGKPDFLFNLTNHYNSTALTLFLSSEADPGDLVKECAQHCTVGC